ncbi:MAG: type II toxin-antitoxin system RelE/ParE family toxin [Methanosarcinales archaeon]
MDKELQIRIAKKLELLKKDPYKCKPLKGSMKGNYRLRVGDYRVIYYIDETKKWICLKSVDHRKKVYKS